MYEIFFAEEAETQLAKLDRVVAQRILNKLRWLAENFDAIIPESLVAQWQGFYKLRVGDYRIVYWVKTEHRQIIIHFLGHRSTIYKQK